MASTPRPPALCIAGTAGPALFGLATAERMRRQFASAGVKIVLTPEQAVGHQGPVIVVRADAALDRPLIPVLIGTPKLMLTGEGPERSLPLAAHVEASGVAAAIAVLSGDTAALSGLDLNPRAPDELDVKFWDVLRKRETPYAYAVSPVNLAKVEWRMFMGTYKGATDIVTKHVWPVPAFYVTRWLAPRGITPNMVTAVSAILMVLALWLFLRGDYALGLACGWVMIFLDTVDGKLARTTLTSSKWGNTFDHGIDLVHPPFWYIAWGLGLSKVGLGWNPVTFWWVIGAILGGYVLQRLMELVAVKRLGLVIHIWRRMDTLFRQVTARRNPNLILLTLGVLTGRPDWGLMAVAIWTILCLVLHGLQLMQALAARRSGPLVSWMTQG